MFRYSECAIVSSTAIVPQGYLQSMMHVSLLLISERSKVVGRLLRYDASLQHEGGRNAILVHD